MAGEHGKEDRAGSWYMRVSVKPLPLLMRLCHYLLMGQRGGVEEDMGVQIPARRRPLASQRSLTVEHTCVKGKGPAPKRQPGAPFLGPRA